MTFYIARNARIASAVLATAIPSVRLSVCLSVRQTTITGSNFGNLTAFRAIFSHIFTAHAQERPLMNFRLKF